MAQGSLLKSDVNSAAVLKIVEQLYSSEIRDAYEVLTIFFHSCLLEVGFLPKDVPEAKLHESMPPKWKNDKVYKIFYTHSCCSSLTCMTVVPVYNSVMVHGILCDTDFTENISTTINVDMFMKRKSNISDIPLNELFYHPDILYMTFKDGFCLPLLNFLHESAGDGKLYGFPALMDELKMEILKFLPVKEVLSLSVVNKNLNRLANCPYLWKFLFNRDFGKGGVPDYDFEDNWQQKYKTEYMKRKRQSPRRALFHPYLMPRFFPVAPDMDIGFDFDPIYPDIFPRYPSLYPPPYRFT